MAAGNIQIFGAAKENVAKGLINLHTGVFACTLHTNAYTPIPNTHALWSDVSGSQVAAGGGYSTGGQELDLVVTRSGGTVTIDAADANWPSSTITAKYAMLTQKAAGIGGSLVNGDYLLGYGDMDTASSTASVASTGSTFLLAWNSLGLFTLS